MFMILTLVVQQHQPDHGGEGHHVLYVKKHAQNFRLASLPGNMQGLIYYTDPLLREGLLNSPRMSLPTEFV